MNGTEHPALAKGAEGEARPEGSIEMPDGVLVRCPLAKFKMRDVGKHCPTCESFGGLEDRFPGASLHPAARYLVLCFAEPVKRQLVEFEQ